MAITAWLNFKGSHVSIHWDLHYFSKLHTKIYLLWQAFFYEMIACGNRLYVTF